MSRKSKNKFKNKFKPRTESDSIRVRNNREEREVKEELPKINFNFKDFDRSQCGQTFQDWEEDKLLSEMLDKFGHICEMTIPEAKSNKVLTIYKNFPTNSDFKHPNFIAEDVIWAVIRNIKGQKGRVAGHIINNTFYVVFLDKNHRFFISQKKNT